MRAERRRFLGPGLLAGLVACALAIPGAHAAVVGPPTAKLDNSNYGRVCGGLSCTFVNQKLSVGRVRAPISGTITKWRAMVGEAGVGTGPVPVKLQVLRKTVDEPGVAADQYEAVRESAEESTTVEGLNKFHASLRIRKGDYIGLAALDEDVEAYGLDMAPGNRSLVFAPPFVPDEPAVTPDTILDQDRLLFNATIRD